MKLTFNLSTDTHDLDRFADRADFEHFAEGFDGVELMVFEPDARAIVPKERVVGVHLNLWPTWMDLWRQNHAALLAEFGSEAAARAHYGGTPGPALLAERLRAELAKALDYGAEYVVLHASHATIEESFTGRFRYSDEAVVDALAECVNTVFTNDGLPWLLLENLWSAGFRFTSPTLTRRMLSAIAHPRTGIMLDTGHLMHTNTGLRNEAQALAYIHEMLDAHGALAQRVRGIHLNMALTGAIHRRAREQPPLLAADYPTRCGQLYTHIFQVDLHRPFTHPGVSELVRRIAPDWLTCEFISENNIQLAGMLRRQRQALAGVLYN